MKTKQILMMAFFAASCVMSAIAQKSVSLALPGCAGTLYLGINGKGTDRWLTACDDALKKKWLTIDSTRIKGAPAVVVAVTNRNMPDSMRLAWMFGGCDAPETTHTIVPEHCRNNVFNVEGSQVYVYRGKVMGLRMTRAIFPPQSEVRLCDGRRQDTPATAFGSGKRTDAPVLCGMTKIDKGETVYLCIFSPHRNSDYTYTELPELMNKDKRGKQ